jgi:hypothetical protein
LAHLFRCEGCSAEFDWETLKAFKWVCPQCAAVVAPMPTEKQLHLAESLGIERPDTLTLPEISQQIKERMEDDRRTRRLEIETLAQERKRSRSLDDATGQELINETVKRFGDIILIQGGQADVRDFQLLTNMDRIDPIRVLHQLSYYAAVGEWPKRSTAPKEITRTRMPR